jgi:hypothetical protein
VLFELVLAKLNTVLRLHNDNLSLTHEWEVVAMLIGLVDIVRQLGKAFFFLPNKQ